MIKKRSLAFVVPRVRVRPGLDQSLNNLVYAASTSAVLPIRINTVRIGSGGDEQFNDLGWSKVRLWRLIVRSRNGCCGNRQQRLAVSVFDLHVVVVLESKSLPYPDPRFRRWRTETAFSR